MFAEPSPSATPDRNLSPAASTPPANRKRKRNANVAAASPAPDQNGTGTGTPEVLYNRADLWSRERLDVSRGPVFIPVSDDSEFFKTDSIGINRIGYRYTPAGIKPRGSAQPFRTIESNPRTYRVSWEDRSPFVYVTKDGLGLQGSKGFRSARCNAPIREGNWYMEVKVITGGGSHVDGRKEGSHVRLGWARREAPLNGPVGLDGYSYGYRDKTGEKVTLSRPRPYGRPFASGDVIGMYISLPPKRQPDPIDPLDPAHIRRERIAIDLKGQEVFEMLEYPQCKEMSGLMDYSAKSSTSAPLPSASTKKPATAKLPERGLAASRPNPVHLRLLPMLSSSRIAFFVNGECQGTAFQDIYDYLQLRADKMRKATQKRRGKEGVKEHRENPFDDGTLGYYPFISLFNGARVQMNAGPDFQFPPPNDINAVLDGNQYISSERMWNPICERYNQFLQEQWDLDEKEEGEAKVEAIRAATREEEEAEKQAKRTKKRQDAEAKKQAKKAALERSAERDLTPFSSMMAGMTGQPSPLRHGTSYTEDQPSPAPTFGSGGDMPGTFSNYMSENGDIEPLEEPPLDQESLVTPEALEIRIDYPLEHDMESTL